LYRNSATSPRRIQRQWKGRSPRRLPHGGARVVEAVGAGKLAEQPVEAPVFLVDDDDMFDPFQGIAGRAASVCGKRGKYQQDGNQGTVTG
jgi:hypothetical protein